MLPVACLVLMDADGCLLATRRPPGKALGGLWEFPGGKVEAGEHAADALRREIREELHLELDDLQPLPPVEHTYPFGAILLLPFLARCGKRPPIHLSEHDAHIWIAPAAAPTLPWAPADLPVLEQLRAVPSM